MYIKEKKNIQLRQKSEASFFRYSFQVTTTFNVNVFVEPHSKREIILKQNSKKKNTQFTSFKANYYLF